METWHSLVYGKEIQKDHRKEKNSPHASVIWSSWWHGRLLESEFIYWAASEHFPFFFWHNESWALRIEGDSLHKQPHLNCEQSWLKKIFTQDPIDWPCIILWLLITTAQYVLLHRNLSRNYVSTINLRSRWGYICWKPNGSVLPMYYRK